MLIAARMIFLKNSDFYFRDSGLCQNGQSAMSPEDTSKTGEGSGASSGGGSDGGIATFSVPGEELKTMLECPVCLQLPREKPIYQVWSLTELYSVGFNNQGSV